MRVMKTLSILALVGAILGAIAATLVAPSAVTWYASPGGAAAALCDCAKLAHEISSQLVHIQVLGAVAGAVVFFAGGIVFKAGRGKKLDKAEAPATGTPPAGAPPAR
jgi:hypothetical protein